MEAADRMVAAGELLVHEQVGQVMPQPAMQSGRSFGLAGA